MPDNELTPEARGLLPEAVEVTTQLYDGEMMQEALVLIGAISTLEVEERNDLWRESAERYQPFKHKIRGLKLALNNAREVYSSAEASSRTMVIESVADSSKVLMRIFESRFGDASDMGVRHLLRTVLCSRTTIAQGVVDASMANTEAEAMRKELGVMRGIRALELNSMTLPSVIEAVLTGRLHLSRQTQTGSR